MNDLEERRETSVARTATKGALVSATILASGMALTPLGGAIANILPLEFQAAFVLIIGDGGSPSFDPPATPTIDATVLSDSSAVLIGSVFNGDGADTHNASIFQVDTIDGDWSTPVWADTTGAQESDTVYTLMDGGSYKGRVAYSGTGGGYSSFSDSVAFTPVGVPVPAFSQEWDYADSAAFRNASDLTHRCSPDWPNCVGGSAISTTSFVSGLSGTPWGGTKAARTTYASASRATSSPWNESDVFSQVRWDLAGGTNTDHIVIRGWLRFSHADSVVGDTVTWSHLTGGMQKTYFVNCGGGDPRCIEMKFGGGATNSTIEAKISNGLFGRRDNLTYQEAHGNGRWIEFCIERKLASSGGIFRMKVDTLLVASLTNITGDTGTEFDSFEHGVNALPDSDGAWLDWGGQYVYTDTTGLASAYSVCDFSGDG